MEQLTYRYATIDDLPAIVDIYNSTVASRMVTADTEPVTVESRIGWFNKRSPDKRPIWMVEYENGQTIGWAAFQSFYGRPAYDTTAEVSIYLDKAQRGKGLGKQILQYCIQSAPQLGIKTLLGFIFAHNAPSLQLFQRAGFEEWATLPDVAILDEVERTLKIVGRRVG